MTSGRSCPALGAAVRGINLAPHASCLPGRHTSHVRTPPPAPPPASGKHVERRNLFVQPGAGREEELMAASWRYCGARAAPLSRVVTPSAGGPAPSSPCRPPNTRPGPFGPYHRARHHEGHGCVPRRPPARTALATPRTRHQWYGRSWPSGGPPSPAALPAGMGKAAPRNATRPPPPPGSTDRPPAAPGSSRQSRVRTPSPSSPIASNAAFRRYQVDDSPSCTSRIGPTGSSRTNISAAGARACRARSSSAEAREPGTAVAKVHAHVVGRPVSGSAISSYPASTSMSRRRFTAR